LCFQSGDESVKESVLSALKGVIKHAGKSVSAAIRSRGCGLLKDLLQADSDEIRSCAAKVIGTLFQVMIIRYVLAIFYYCISLRGSLYILPLLYMYIFRSLALR
jgi:hypothetical protein